MKATESTRLYFERAADQRHPRAQHNFAVLIDRGQVPGKGPEDAAALARHGPPKGP